MAFAATAVVAACSAQPVPGDAGTVADVAADSADAAVQAVAEVTIVGAAADGAGLVDVPVVDSNDPELAEAAASSDDVGAEIEVVATEISLPTCATLSDCPTAPPAGPCTEWACKTGHCIAVARPPGALCATVGPCLQLACTAVGACAAQVVKGCTAPPCYSATCSLVTGNCDLAALVTGTCDDGKPCTLWDLCEKGACVGYPAPTYPEGPCSIKACDPTTSDYSITHLPKGATCSDANPCTLGDTCDGGGSCMPGKVISCAAPPCQAAACDPNTGGCAAVALDATPCDDGQACTSGDTCAVGACKGGAWTCQCQVATDCDDGSPCTTGLCNDGKCLQLPAATTACTDGTACTAGDVCANGTCLPGSATNCDDGNACSADACLPASGACASVPLNELQCTDGNLCTWVDTCKLGVCVGAKPQLCADSTTCLSVNCNPVSGACDSVALAGPCTGSDLCIIGQQCSKGQCQGGAKVQCEDGNPCTTDICNAATGGCTAQAKPNSTSCGSYQQCSQGTCTCVLGHFAIAPQGKESFRSVVAVDSGFAAVGDSDQPGGAKGLFALVDAANQPVIVQRIAAGDHLSFAAVVAAAPGFWAMAEFADGSVRLVRLDPLGNVSAVVPLFGVAQAQALVGVDGGVLALAADAWSAGAQTRLARVDATGKVVWTKAISPASPAHAALGTALVLHGSTALVVGQDLLFAAPGQTAGWVAAISPGDGALLEKASLPWPSGGLVATAAVAGSHLWAAGSFAGPSSASGGALLLWMDLSPASALPVAATVVVAESVAGQLAAVEPFANGVVAVGWRTLAGAAAATAGSHSPQGPAWSHSWPHKGGQTLRGAAVLGDGSVVGVGGRAALQGGPEAMWVRLAGEGTAACL